MYYIVKMDNSGAWDALASFDTYSEAELEHEDYCNKYPYAWVEVISKADYNASK